MLWGPYLCVMFLVEVREGITYVQSVLKEVGVEEYSLTILSVV